MSFQIPVASHFMRISLASGVHHQHECTIQKLSGRLRGDGEMHGVGGLVPPSSCRVGSAFIAKQRRNQ